MDIPHALFTLSLKRQKNSDQEDTNSYQRSANFGEVSFSPFHATLSLSVRWCPPNIYDCNLQQTATSQLSTLKYFHNGFLPTSTPCTNCGVSYRSYRLQQRPSQPHKRLPTHMFTRNSRYSSRSFSTRTADMHLQNNHYHSVWHERGRTSEAGG